MQITKLKFTKDGTVAHYEVPCSRKNDLQRVEFHSPDDPHPDLMTAAAMLRNCVLGRIGIELDAAVRFVGVTVKYDDDYGIGFVATLSLECPDYASPLVLNSPFVRGELDETDPPEALITTQEREALDELLRETELFVTGTKRAQADLFEAA